MLLSPRYQFLFVHIPKTGGTSIRAALRYYKWTDPYRIPLFLLSRLSSFTGHRLACKLPRHAKIIAAKEMLPADYFDSLLKFAFVRNPWDLQVSSYHHLRRERPQLLEGIHDFEAFLKTKLDPDRDPVYHFDVTMELQASYLMDLQGQIIVDCVGRYERLEQDFCSICERLGIQPPKLPHKRRAADRKDFRQYYNDRTAEWIQQHFQRDIELFGYSFDE